jgi:hypothetical protein
MMSESLHACEKKISVDENSGIIYFGGYEGVLNKIGSPAMLKKLSASFSKKTKLFSLSFLSRTMRSFEAL